MKLIGRKIYSGQVSGETLVTSEPISFYGGINEEGIVVAKDHELEGVSITNKILVFPRGIGSTVGSWRIYQLAKVNKGPIGMILNECEAIVAVGCVIAEVPCIDKIDIGKIDSGVMLFLNADKGVVEF